MYHLGLGEREHNVCHKVGIPLRDPNAVGLLFYRNPGEKKEGAEEWSGDGGWGGGLFSVYYIQGMYTVRFSFHLHEEKLECNGLLRLLKGGGHSPLLLLCSNMHTRLCHYQCSLEK